jgi:hypothetical protein
MSGNRFSRVNESALPFSKTAGPTKSESVEVRLLKRLCDARRKEQHMDEAISDAELCAQTTRRLRASSRLPQL